MIFGGEFRPWERACLRIGMWLSIINGTLIVVTFIGKLIADLIGGAA